MNKLSAVFICVLLAGCDQLVEQKVVESKDVESTIDCTYTGFCLACGWHMGEYDCGFGLHSYCKGTQPATIRIQTVDSLYQRNDKTRYNEFTQRRQVVATHGACD